MNFLLTKEAIAKREQEKKDKEIIERKTAFLKDYRAVVEKHGWDFIPSPVFVAHNGATIPTEKRVRFEKSLLNLCLQDKVKISATLEIVPDQKQ